MRQWLNRNWGDPVWSKVIAWAICTPIGLAAGAVLLWSRSHFSFNFDFAWAAAVSSLRTIWRWLDSPSPLPQGGIWLTLVLFATLIAGMIRQQRREIAVWSARSVRAAAEARAHASAEIATLRSRIEAQDAIIASHAETANKITPHQLDELATRRAPARFQLVPPVSSLDSESAHALIALASAYPGGIERERLINQMGVGVMVGEQVLEGLAGLMLIEYRRAAPYGGGSDVWALTKRGRDYCVENQLNKRVLGR